MSSDCCRKYGPESAELNQRLFQLQEIEKKSIEQAFDISSLRAELAAMTKERDELKRAIDVWKTEEQCWRDDMGELRDERDAAIKERDEALKLAERRKWDWGHLMIERDRYREALEKIAELKHHQVVSGHDSWQQVAREALAASTTNPSSK
jgi:uncharacterized protein YwgA